MKIVMGKVSLGINHVLVTGVLVSNAGGTQTLMGSTILLPHPRKGWLAPGF